MPANRSGNENSCQIQPYILGERAGAELAAWHEALTECQVSLPGFGMAMEPERNRNDSRPLTENEHDLIEALLGAVRSGVGRYIGQLDSLEVIGGCGCGCPSINFALRSGNPDGRVQPLILADAESPEGVSVGVILWVRSGCLSGLEVHPWDGTVSFRLPHPDSLHNLRTGTL